MKSRYTTLDLQAALSEILNSDVIGLRVVNVYDIDAKTYLIKLATADKKFVILIESGNRFHLTEFDWPKNMMPSGFSMKCRKHLRGKRLSSVTQLGVDRIVDFCFGYNEAAYHFIVELYDRGNIILTDYEFNILQLLRVRKDNEDVRFAVRERYPVEKARAADSAISQERLIEILKSAKQGEQLKRILNPQFIFGPALLEHSLLEAGFPSGCKIGDGFQMEQDSDRLLTAIQQAEQIMENISKTEAKGYIIQKREKKPTIKQDENTEELLTYSEFHPYLFKQHQNDPFKEIPSFNKAVDEFFSKLESQKLDVRTLQQEKNALKKLENVKQDHVKRLEALQKFQDEGMRKAALIELNLPLVDQATKVINSAIANQIDWEEINDIVKDAQSQGDPVACAIKSLKLEINQITMKLVDPYDVEEDSDDDSDDDVQSKNIKNKKQITKFVLVDIDLGISAFSNARTYHDRRRQAASKEQKTIDASKMALKSAEKKTKQTLKEVATSAVINKARKSYWFEKFLWFVSSDNYVVIAGRDQQQNELLVKRYLKQGDLYVHADLHGASSVILKNPTGQPVPPRTLNEAGTMAICYSAGWQARIVTSAWWVYHDQVSKTAPSGEYLTTGSFMIRGKKNYLPPSYLMMGFGIMFKLDDTCVSKHANERRPKRYEGEEEFDPRTNSTDKTENPDDEIALLDSDNEDGSDKKDRKNEINEIESNNVKEEQENFASLNSENGDVDGNGDIDGSDNVEENDDVDRNEDVGRNEIHDQMEDNKTTEELENENDNDNDDDSEDEQGDLYPDTSLQLQYVSGDKYQLQRGMSASSSRTHDNDEEDNVIYLGDDEKVVLGQKQEPHSKQRLSAKQRRDLKKKAKGGLSTENNLEIGQKDKTEKPKKDSSKKEKKSEHPQQPPPQPPKRGQKGKLKKKKEKYKDQDDDEKELIMQFLASAGEPKEPKNKKKGRKGAKQNAGPQKPQTSKSSKIPKDQPLILSSDSFPEQSNVDEADQTENPESVVDNVTKDTEKAKVDHIDDDDEPAAAEDTEKENVSILDTLTGCPYQDDLLLFAIPVCAPYGVMQNFKYKVKVTPGTGRKGKAAKSAIHLFSTSKEANQREKDLLKSLKDVDISRNMPGKVKISAPNLQKSKK